MTPAERVARGAALLDERRPGWAGEIKYRLDIASCSDCVLGQAFGNYWRGIDSLFPDATFADTGLPSCEARYMESAAHGFAPNDARNRLAESKGDVRALEAAWTVEITKRAAGQP